MNKKTVIALIVIIVLILITAVYYFFTQKPAPVSELTATNATSTDSFPIGGNRSLGGQLDSDSSSLATGSSTEPNPDFNNQLNSRFSLVTKEPVAGVITLGQGASSTVWYAEKNTGNLYRLKPGGSPERISNTTIPKVYQLLGVENKAGVQLIIRYLKNNQIQNYLAKVKIATSTSGESFINPAGQSIQGELTGSFLPSTANEFAASPDHNSLAYLDRSNNQTRLVTTDWGMQKPSTIMTSPLLELKLAWLATSTIMLSTKPSGIVPGYAYSLDIKTGKLVRLIDNVPGLSILPSPDGKKLLYSGTGGTGPFLALYNLKKQTVSRLSLNTLVDKCGWSEDSITIYCGVPAELPAGIYPDQWLSSEISLADRLWQIEIATTTTTKLVFNPALQNVKNLDVQQIVYSQADNRLYVLSKNGLSLWSLDLRLGF